MNKNPFDFDGAKNLPDRLLIDWFIDDHNYSRFLKSSRNVLLLGHRGCGKSMTLLYYSLALELKKVEIPLQQKDLSHFGIYISCSTPLARRVDHDFFEDDKFSKAISEHYFVLSIAVAIAEHCEHIVRVLDEDSLLELKEDLFYVFDEELPADHTIFKCIKRTLNKELRNTQEQFLSFENRSDFTFARTFYTRRPRKLSATPDLSGTVLPLCPIPNSASKSAPSFNSVKLKASACAALLA